MSEAATRTDDRFLYMVYGGLALAATVLMGGVITMLHTETIRWAASLFLIGFLVAIAYLAIEL